MTKKSIWLVYGYTSIIGECGPQAPYTGTIGLYTTLELAEQGKEAAQARGYWESIGIEQWELNLSIESPE